MDLFKVHSWWGNNTQNLRGASAVLCQTSHYFCILSNLSKSAQLIFLGSRDEGAQKSFRAVHTESDDGFAGAP